jgi:tetratricopeptide (TPR) repeat protein
MRRARIIERSLSVALASTAAVSAFLFVPLDRAHAPRRQAAVSPPPAMPTAPPGSIAAAAPRRPPARALGRSQDVDPLAWIVAPDAPYTFLGASAFELHQVRPVCAPVPAGPVDDVIGARLALSDDPDAGFGADVLFLLGAAAQSVGDVGRAADYFESFARHTPDASETACTPDERLEGGCPDAPAALENAMLFREALGQTDAALADAQLFVATYAETRVRDAARVSRRAGRLLERRGDHRGAAAHYRDHVVTFARHGTPAEAIGAYVRLGRARWQSGDERGAARAFRVALRHWRRAADRIAAASDASGEEFSHALEAVAEAGFHLAELRRRRYEAVVAPPYRGDGTAADVGRWVRRALRPWVARKLRALEDTRAAYERVSELGATEWKIAAEARIAELYLDVGDAIARAPTPTEIRGEGELAVAVAVGDDWRAEPLRRLRAPARTAWERCMAAAVSSRHFGSWSARCASGLSEVDPERHPPLRELFRRRHHVASSTRAPAARPRTAVANGVARGDRCDG